MPSQLPKVRVQGLIMVGGIALLAAGLVVYLSSCQRLSRLEGELADVLDQIAAIENSFTKDQLAFADGVQSLEAEYETMIAKFPSQEEEGIRRLSEAARGSGLEIISIRSEPKTPFLDRANGKVTLESRICQRSFIAVEMRGSYKDLVQFLTVLRKDLPVHVTFEDLKVGRHSGGGGLLTISMDLNLYLLS